MKIKSHTEGQIMRKYSGVPINYIQREQKWRVKSVYINNCVHFPMQNRNNPIFSLILILQLFIFYFLRPHRRRHSHLDSLLLLLLIVYIEEKCRPFYLPENIFSLYSSYSFCTLLIRLNTFLFVFFIFCSSMNGVFFYPSS